jgi:4-hydroxybenzoate polyprenyltransferase
MKRSTTVDKQVEVIGSWWRWVGMLYIELRPHQWVKNLLVLAPLLFSKSLFNSVAIGQTAATFVLFCLVSSSVYLLNDIKDLKQDRLHPQKSLRPLASGEISVKTGGATMLLLLLTAVVGGLMIDLRVAFILLIYWVVNLLYSTWLKRQVILDVFAVASGFLLRVAAGAIAIQIEMSHWLLLCTTLLALFLGFSKRRHELLLLRDVAPSHRQVLSEYSTQFLDMMIAIVTASTVMSYAFYTVSEETVARFQTEGLLVTVPFVLYGIFRYLYLVYHRNGGGNPTYDILADPYIIADIGLWATVTALIIYWK